MQVPPYKDFAKQMESELKTKKIPQDKWNSLTMRLWEIAIEAQDLEREKNNVPVDVVKIREQLAKYDQEVRAYESCTQPIATAITLIDGILGTRRPQLIDLDSLTVDAPSKSTDWRDQAETFKRYTEGLRDQRRRFTVVLLCEIPSHMLTKAEIARLKEFEDTAKESRAKWVLHSMWQRMDETLIKMGIPRFDLIAHASGIVGEAVSADAVKKAIPRLPPRQNP